MKIELDFTKDIYSNASDYYNISKKIRKKIESLKQEIVKTEQEMNSKKTEKPKELKMKIEKKREWYEKFRWFYTSDGFLVLGGRDQKQNELLFSKYLQENDLFMHADVHGAPVIIIKNGQNAPESNILEAAYFSVAYSSAWKNGLPFADTYAVKPDQVSKSVSGQYVAKGSFVISGERKWFRNIPLKIFMSLSPISIFAGNISEEKISEIRKKSAVFMLSPGNKDKKFLVDDIKRFLSKKKLEISIDEVHSVLPSGGLSWVML